MQSYAESTCTPAPVLDHEVIVVHGVVQGVGFRPFVYRLAEHLGVRGDVSNSGGNVIINAVAAREVLSQFKEHLQTQAPPHARPDSIESTRGADARFCSFAIVKSTESLGNGAPSFAIPPDLATCPECLKELFDRQDRRYRHPFINCTNCGPRYSITTSFPYDRSRTTMQPFAMCPECEREYNDPHDRRFHAEPIACPRCGPRLTLYDEDGQVMSDGPDVAIRIACDAIRAGRIVAVKGIGGFHLLVDARNDTAVTRLRERKAREAKPLALIFPSMGAVRAKCSIGEEEEELLASYAAPIVLLRRLQTPGAKRGIADAVAPGSPLLGVMLPYSPLHHLLMHELGFPVVATSGNRSEEPVCFENEEALSRMHGIADLFLVHDRSIKRFVDDSVVRFVAGRPLFLRRSRGYVPNPIGIPVAVPESVALGGQQKNTIAIGSGKNVFPSRHIGDLDSPRSLQAMKGTITDLSEQLRITPTHVACDLHPGYINTRIAPTFGKTVQPIQHHYAHILSAMAENGINTDVLGIAWDGTGYGEDGTIWGGEFLKANFTGCTRFAALRTFPLLGGEKAIREPRRVALGLLHECMGSALWELNSLAPVLFTHPAERRVIERMLEQDMNSPKTSSMGRLFDGVASLLGIRQSAQFEGQAAMELEFVVNGSEGEDLYPFAYEDAECLRIDWRPLILGIVSDMKAGVSVSQIASRFHSTLAQIASKVAGLAGNHDVVLGGGCFQNRVLLERTISMLRAGGFDVWWPKLLPPNDGGLALGQIVALNQLTRAGC